MAQGLAQTALEAGELARKDRRWQAALRYYDRALTEDPTFSLAWAGKADALAHREQPEAANRAIEKAYWTFDGCQPAMHTEAKLQHLLRATEDALRSQDYPAADSLLSVALQLAPTSPLVAYTEGRLQLSNRQYAAAIECFHLAILLADTPTQANALRFHSYYAQLQAGQHQHVRTHGLADQAPTCAHLLGELLLTRKWLQQQGF